MKQTYKQRLVEMQKKSKNARVQELVKFLKAQIENGFRSRSTRRIDFDYNDLFDFTGYGGSYTEVKLAVAKIAAEGVSILIDEDDNCTIRVSL